MKWVLGTLSLLTMTTSYALESKDTAQFTVSGELIPNGLFISTSIEERQLNLPEDMDWSTSRVVIAREVVSSTGEAELVELESGHFENGSITVTGEIEEPVDAKILLELGGRAYSTLDVVISPGSTISFVLMEYHAHLELLGVSRTSRDSKKKFTVSGDFSSMAEELEGAIVQVTAGEADAEGLIHELIFGKVILDGGKFVIDAEVDEPRVVNVLIVSHTDFAQTQAIIEPGAEIGLSLLNGSLKDMFATARKGKHAQLVDAWQQSEEYRATKHLYRIAYQNYLDKAKEQGTLLLENGRDDDLVNGSEHMVEKETPKYQELAQRLSQLRYDFLNDIASNAKDPVDVLLALELGAYRRSEAAVPIFDRLTEALDSDLVARRLTIAREAHELFHLARVGNDKGLKVGSKVSDFNLLSLDGEEVWLSEVLTKKDFVLVDFWASWCGPCIATFPALTELHSSYVDRGFSIISVSTDKVQEMWSDASEQYQPTWINLGELEGFGGEVAVAYGVNALPKSYLLDSDGRVVHKDLSTDQLKEFLVREYGE